MLVLFFLVVLLVVEEAVPFSVFFLLVPLTPHPSPSSVMNCGVGLVEEVEEDDEEEEEEDEEDEEDEEEQEDVDHFFTRVGSGGKCGRATISFLFLFLRRDRDNRSGSGSSV